MSAHLQQIYGDRRRVSVTNGLGMSPDSIANGWYIISRRDASVVDLRRWRVQMILKWCAFDQRVNMKGVGNDDDDDGNKTRISEDNNKININSIYQRYDEDDNGKKKS